MTGETLLSMTEDVILEIIGDIFLQNLGSIISKLGISLCRIEDVFLQNGDGTVSREEFQEMCNNLSPEEVQRVFLFF